MSALSDYSLIGNCRSAALVSKQGSLDWCCFPEFHSPAIFSAIIDKEKGGHFSLSPVDEFHSSQRYLEDTNVVETLFTNSQGTVSLLDGFAVATEEEKMSTLYPDHEILRILTCVAGSMTIKLEYAPTLYYGKRAATLENKGNFGIKFCRKENSYILLSNLSSTELIIRKNFAEAVFVISYGESLVFSLSCSSQAPAIIPELQLTAGARMKQTKEYWRSWISQCTYNGIYSGWVRRSALLLKLLVHAPSGAIIAAPSTSLPEAIGGERNWDYRYCWLRDASFTVRVLLKLGFEQEAHAYINWIIHATRLTWPKLQVVYSVFGESKLREQVLPWLEGFKRTKPVRIGNGAYDQHQLDVYGDVIDAFFSYSEIVKEFDKRSEKFLIGLGNMICRLWDKKDHGIWEVRSKPSHHTHSKVMAWVGLDRLIKLTKKYQWASSDIHRYERVKNAIGKTIERHGYNRELGSYTRELNGQTLDAGALVFSLVGYCDAGSPGMISTVNKIYSELSCNDLIYRYRDDDGLKGKEGCFGICSFWLSENFAKSGNLAKAVQIFDAVLDHASPSGLIAEEIDPVSHELLGNYPQGFSHIGLINAALSINEAYKKGGLI